MDKVTQKKHAHHIVVAREEGISIEENCELTRFLTSCPNPPNTLQTLV
jgi:hypothetical protein